MRAIIVDDEPLALHRMRKLVGKFSCVQKVETFQSPSEVLRWIPDKKVDIAFLDIELPEINGMVLGEQLLNYNPKLHIIFITAFSSYAVEAFEINALDYILKPVKEERLTKSLEKIARRTESRESRESLKLEKNKGMLCCLQYLSYQDPIKGVQTIHWRTTKAQDLFSYLLHHRNQTVHKEKILELLWPDIDEEKASSLLHTTVYQVRKTIIEKRIDVKIRYNDRGYILELGEILLDFDVWEIGVRFSPPVSHSTIAQHKELMSLYRGDYFAEYPNLWIEAEQERLRLIWLEHVKKVASFYVETKQYMEAIQCYNQIQEKDPYLEEGYLGLMKVNTILGYHAEVKKQYDKLLQCFQEDLGILPSKEVLVWYQKWLTSNRKHSI